jgi:hypothetical protein
MMKQREQHAKNKEHHHITTYYGNRQPTPTAPLNFLLQLQRQWNRIINGIIRGKTTIPYSKAEEGRV